MRYFAYGSNMSSRRLRERVPSGQPHCVAVLHGHMLAFHKRSADGSAKCGVLATGNPNDRVYGVLYVFDAHQLPQLDLAEGNGYSYHRRSVEVDVGGRALVAAECYFAADVSPGPVPYSWYREHVLVGAREAGLPAWYVAQVCAIECTHDHDARRHARELAIYAPAEEASDSAQDRRRPYQASLIMADMPRALRHSWS